jgi:hypothetical protein
VAGIAAGALIVAATTVAVDAMIRSFPVFEWVRPWRAWLALWSCLVSATALMLVGRDFVS